jgi:hypothetical protein
MIIKKIKRLILEDKAFQINQINLLKEVEWAHIYHDSIRGKPWLEDLPLNIGRWSGNYAFFYVLNRILSDYKPRSIFEMGLGESSKFVSRYLDFYLKDSFHTIIEQDEDWKEFFNSNFTLSEKSKIEIYELDKINIRGFDVNIYKGFENRKTHYYDLYIVDGPFGSPRFSRYDIISIVNKMKWKDEFIIILDDYNRLGERDTAKELVQILESKNIRTYKAVYQGNKSLMVIGTEKYKYVASL